jgi:hypothetical protein
MPSVHRIKITAVEREYQTTGAVSLKCGTNPMRVAAQALLDAGRDPADRLQGVFEGGQISPVSLASIVRPRSIPKTDHRPPSASRNVDQ